MPQIPESKRKAKADSDDEEQLVDVDDVLVEKSNLWQGGVTQFLANVYEYVSYRLITCMTHCLVCDKDTGVASVNFPICSNPACVKEYQTTPCGSIMSMIKSQPQVVDLLVSLFYVAASTPNALRGYNRNGVGLPEENKGD